MSATVAAAVKAAIVILSNEEARKKVGWVIVAILSPLIVLVVLLCAILSGTSQHNVSAVELCFHGGSISASATPEYRRYIEDMRNSFDQLDEVIAEINSQSWSRRWKGSSRKARKIPTRETGVTISASSMSRWIL